MDFSSISSNVDAPLPALVHPHPAEQAEEKKADQENAEQGQAAAWREAGEGPLSVLHLEDCESDASLISRFLEKGGYRLLHHRRVETADEMRAAMDEQAWDVILADYRLPQFGAASALEIVQSTGRDIPFIIVSGVVGDGAAAAMMKRGAHDFVMKSNLARLAPAVERELKESRNRKARREAQEALTRSQRQFRMLAESIPQLVWMANSVGETVYCNARFQEQLGLGPNPSADRWFQLLHRDEREACVRAWKRCLATEADFLQEGRLLLVGGNYRWFKLHSVPLKGDATEATLWFGTCTDIDDQKQSQNRLAQTNAELARSNAMLEQFAYAASHDLQEPLRNVVISVQMLADQSNGKLDRKTKEWIERAVGASLRMQRLIRDLLLFSRVGRQDQPWALVSLQEVVDEALRNLAATVKDSSATITREDLPIVAGNAGQLIQLFQNLIGNALKYRKDNVAPAVHISAERQEGEWVVAVRDNGIGINPAYFKRIFQIFKRLHGRDKYEGTGIGLAICEKIVERHQGRLWVESAEGTGATFYFTIPCASGERVAVAGPGDGRQC